MRDATAAIWKLLRTGKPVGCVLYEDFAAREQLLELMYLVSPREFDVHRIEEAAEAFAEAELGTLLLFAPRNEIDAVRAFDHHRAALEKRTAPVILFLLRRGSGLQELASRRGLSAMLAEQEIDPAAIDAAETQIERTRFCDEVAQTPEEWLDAWRAGDKPDTPENNLWLHQALLLERSTRGH